MRDLLTALALSPVLVPQGLWTAYRAARLPEAAGPRHGTTGTGAPLRVLVTGDSSAAGVGVAQQTEALGGQIAAHLAPYFTVTWEVAAKTGGTAASTVRMLERAVPQPCDVAVVALGVNDTKNGVSQRKWLGEYARLIDLLTTQQGAKHIYVSGLPPLGEFPLLPRPLSSVLGARAKRLDALLQDMARQHPQVTHIPMVLSLDASHMASDGFHPGQKVYAEWAHLIAQHIKQDVARRGA